MSIASSEFSRHISLVLVMLLTGLLCGNRASGESRGDIGSVGGNLGQDKFLVPGGTVLPVRLNHGLSSKNARAGQAITGRLMQDVPLPNASKIPEGAKVLGTILSVSAAGNNSNGKISFRFEQIEVHRRRIAIVANLRATASLMEVESAQIPETSPGFGTPYVWATTDQIGGDVKYGVGGPVTDKWSHTVGEGTYTGVLVSRPSTTGDRLSGRSGRRGPSAGTLGLLR